MFLRKWTSAFLLGFSGLVLADATIPDKDVSGARDPAGLGRYAGSLIVEQQVKAYDEVTLPLSPLQPSSDENARDRMNNRIFMPQQKLSLEGKLMRTVYLLPEGRTSLEVLRNYQQLIGEKGGKTLYECKAEQCGGDIGNGADHGGGEQGLMAYVFPQEQVNQTSFSNAACSVTMDTADLLYFVGELATGGTSTRVGVLTYTANNDLYCKAFNGRAIAIVVTLEGKAREQNMVTVKASELAQSIAASGKIALYGITFDFDKADIKPESKAQLDEIGALLKADGALKLMVVGHTDNQGGAAYNMELSKKRADAVVARLVNQYGIAADRLLAQGMGSAAPLASNDSEDGRAKNRRVELVKQ
ncbi:MAG: OmpA family protein [Tahibacter sp.]